MNAMETSLTIDWPIGPDYSDWVGADGVAAWVSYKLKSASFHIETLSRVGQAHGYARLVGVEMALDAALAALCSAFDASAGGIIYAAERYFTRGIPGTPPPWKAMQPFEYNWSNCLKRVVPPLREEQLS